MGLKSVKVFFGIFFFLLSVLHLSGQNNNPISFSVENEKFSIALSRLSQVSDLNFSYNSVDELFGEKISYQAINKTPLAILEDLLENSTHWYKQIGNQVVIFRKKEDSENVNEDQEVTDQPVVVIATQDIIPAKIVYDTIVIRDTLIQVFVDTLRVTDTVFVEKVVYQQEIANLNKIDSTDSFNPETARLQGWSATAFFAPVISGFSMADNDNSLDIRNYSMGIAVSKAYDKLNISGSFKLTHFGESFNNTYNITEGGFYRTDTVDKYYTVVDTDTSWYYVTDSLWQPSDFKQYNYNVKNKIGYLDFAIGASYVFYTHKEFKFYGTAGLQMSILIYQSGLAIPDPKNPESVSFADLSFSSPNFLYLVGAGAKYEITDRIDFNPELYYFRAFNQAVDDYPLDKKVSGLGLKFGLTYYF